MQDLWVMIRSKGWEYRMKSPEFKVSRFQATGSKFMVTGSRLRVRGCRVKVDKVPSSRVQGYRFKVSACQETIV